MIGADHVAIRAVADVVAMLLEPISQGKLQRQKLPRADCQRVVHHAIELGLAGVGAIEADIGPRALPSLGMGVERIVAGPLVVGLPGVIRALKQDIGRPVVANDEDHIALPIRFVVRGNGRQPAEIDSAGPVLGNRQPGGRLPTTFVQILLAGSRCRLRLTLKRAQGGHQPGTASAVIAHAENFDRQRPGRVGGDHDLDRFAGPHALPRAIALDPGGAILAAVDADPRQLPIGCPRFAILVFDQARFATAGRRRRGGGLRVAGQRAYRQSCQAAQGAKQIAAPRARQQPTQRKTRGWIVHSFRLLLTPRW